MIGRTIALVGLTGSGKTSQIGELSKSLAISSGKRTLLNAADRGGYRSILPHVKVGIITVNPMPPTDPWGWINSVCGGEGVEEDIGLVAYDSASFMGQALLDSCAEEAKEGVEIGGRPAPKFSVNKGTDQVMKIGSNVDSHFYVVQSFMTKMMWKSTWLIEKGVDIIWTFDLFVGEQGDKKPLVGPKLVGKALTPQIPPWFNYCFMLAMVPEFDRPARHLMYLEPQPEIGGMGVTVGNPRYALDASTPLPAIIEPASLPEALRLIEQGELEAEENLRRELV